MKKPRTAGPSPGATTRQARPFKVLVLGAVIFFSIKSHYDGEKREQEEERERQNRINGS